jgi:hypothetical protein
MYLWKTNKLVKELSEKSITQAEKYKYLLAFMIITAFIIELSSYVPENPSIIPITGSILVFLTTVVGTIYCYRVNQQGDNLDFVDRYISLYIPIFINVTVYFMSMFSLYILIGFIFFSDAFDRFTDSTNWIDVVFIVGFECLFYWILSSSIKKVSNSIQRSEQPGER